MRADAGVVAQLHRKGDDPCCTNLVCADGEQWKGGMIKKTTVPTRYSAANTIVTLELFSPHRVTSVPERERERVRVSE